MTHIFIGCYRSLTKAEAIGKVTIERVRSQTRWIVRHTTDSAPERQPWWSYTGPGRGVEGAP
jgi:hypothetical protein